MATESLKVEFALGSEVSPSRFFKSAFARNFTSNSRDCKSLDYELLDNAATATEEDRNNNSRNNNFLSLVNFTDGRPASSDDAATRAAALWEPSKPSKEVNASPYPLFRDVTLSQRDFALNHRDNRNSNRI